MMVEVADAEPKLGIIICFLAALGGAAYVEKGIRPWRVMKTVLDRGKAPPIHLRGWKPRND